MLKRLFGEIYWWNFETTFTGISEGNFWAICHRNPWWNINIYVVGVELPLEELLKTFQINFWRILGEVSETILRRILGIISEGIDLKILADLSQEYLKWEVHGYTPCMKESCSIQIQMTQTFLENVLENLLEDFLLRNSWWKSRKKCNEKLKKNPPRLFWEIFERMFEKSSNVLEEPSVEFMENFFKNSWNKKRSIRREIS